MFISYNIFSLSIIVLEKLSSSSSIYLILSNLDTFDISIQRSLILYSTYNFKLLLLFIKKYTFLSLFKLNENNFHQNIHSTRKYGARVPFPIILTNFSHNMWTNPIYLTTSLYPLYNNLRLIWVILSL